MKHLLFVSNSSEVNRYGGVFSIPGLEDQLRQSWCRGVPLLLSHDTHRPLGWSRGLALCFEPGLVRSTGLCFVPESKDDVEKIGQLAEQYFSEKILSAVEPHRPSLENRLKQWLTGDEAPFWPHCAALVGKGLARRAFPRVFEEQDKDGLVPLSSLNPVSPGVFEKEGLLIFAHSYFRRSLSRYNSINEPFLGILQRTVASRNLNVRIALDEDMVGLSGTLKPQYEFEYWWGPEFSDDLQSIRPGVFFHEGDEKLRFFHGICRTEFWWHRQDSQQKFECEELRELPSFGIAIDRYGCRFVHSIVAPDWTAPSHLDGAIRMYDKNSLKDRCNMHINHAGRQTEYTKLWRIDGALSVSQWKELITHYYRDNRLIGEYFGGKDDAEYEPPHCISSETYLTPIAKYVPSNLAQGQGVRISVSYHPKNGEPVCHRTIHALDFLLYESEKHYYVEHPTVDLVKLVRRMGEVLPFSWTI